METKFNINKVLFNKLNDYFKDNIRISLINDEILIIVTNEDLFYCIDIENDNIPSFIINDDKSVKEEMIIKDLCYKQINDLKIGYFYDLEFHKYCFYCYACNEYNIYYYDIKYGVIKEYISEEKIIDMCYGANHSILLTQSGKVYEHEVNYYERKKSEKYIHFKLKSFKNYSFKNEEIVMISCGQTHSLALTESGRVFGWGKNTFGQLDVNVWDSSEPIINELNDLKIRKISCGYGHSLLLSCDGNIYAFGWNYFGEVGNGTLDKQRFPIKLELNKKFIDIASHPYYRISMSQSIDGIYYVWGWFEGKAVLSPQSTKYQSFEQILRAGDMIDNMKTFGKLIEFEDSFVKNGFYSKHFEEIQKLGFGSFESVFEVKRRENIEFDFSGKSLRIYLRTIKEIESKEHKAIKRMDFGLENKSVIIKEYLNFSVISRDLYFKNEYLVKHINAWFEESIDANIQKISLYILMELCDKTLDDVIKGFDKESQLKTNGTLTSVGYYIASRIFIQILEGVNYLHKQNPPLIHGDLKPANILLKKDEAKGFCVKIADFGLVAIHDFSKQSHTLEKGTVKYTTEQN
jgi:hypothetical protein